MNNLNSNIIYKNIYVDKYSKQNNECLNLVNHIKSNAFKQITFENNIIKFDKLATLESNSFVNCSNLNEIDLSLSTQLQEIPMFAFKNCELSKIILPTSITKIDDGAFNCCYNLIDININECTNLKILGGLGSKKITELIIPNSVTNICNFGFSHNLEIIKLSTNLLKIDKYTFNSCNSIKSINLPKTIKNIPKCCFIGCENLTNINLENIESIDESAFEDCIELKEINLSNCIKLGPECFKHCINLSMIKNINKIERIGRECFDNCIKLNINFNFKNPIKTIKYHAFNNCELVNKNIFELNIKHLNSLFNYCTIKTLKLINCERIKINFSNWFGLETLDLIECTRLKYISNICNNNIKTMLLPNSISNISDFECNQLKYINWNDLKCLDEIKSFNCRSINNIDLSNTQIRKINNNTFEFCTSLSEIIFGNDLKYIGKNNFKNCDIELVDLSNLKYIYVDEEAFVNCNNLEIILLPINVELQNYAFKNCRNLNYVNIDMVYNYNELIELSKINKIFSGSKIF